MGRKIFVCASECEFLMERVACGGLLPNINFSGICYRCKEVAIGGERTIVETVRDAHWSRCKRRLKKKLGSLGVPDQYFVPKGEGESGEGGKEKEIFSIGDFIRSRQRLDFRRCRC